MPKRKKKVATINRPHASKNPVKFGKKKKVAVVNATTGKKTKKDSTSKEKGPAVPDSFEILIEKLESSKASKKLWVKSVLKMREFVESKEQFDRFFEASLTRKEENIKPIIAAFKHLYLKLDILPADFFEEYASQLFSLLDDKKVGKFCNLLIGASSLFSGPGMVLTKMEEEYYDKKFFSSKS